MTNRERMLAVLRGGDHDAVPFVQYDGIAAPNSEVWNLTGRDSVGILRWTSAHTVSTPNCRWETEDISLNGLAGTRTTIRTPAGDLVQEKAYEPALGTGSTRAHFVRQPDDYPKLLAFLRDMVVRPAVEQLARDDGLVGDDGLLHVSTGRTPFQAMWIEWAGIENLSWHLADCPDVVEECMEALGANLRKVFAILRDAPISHAVVPDNITAPMIGERTFRRWCLPFYRELSEMLAERGLLVFVHMDGDLQPLSRAIGQSGVGGLDSMSPPPDNDTSVGQALEQWPDMRLWVNFPSSLHLAPPEKVYEAAAEILAQGGHSGRLQIQISENVPPGSWRRSYPEIVRAIRDSGTP